ncbi:anti-sigma factor [Oryzicola mucosus]|uniref:Anti-sigma factor n=1 Tax=Oryzicola mucosus TaxID=2767425 RepID=A0A8J6PQS8_9HYPH|nr:anti-sigma factor [Oryzicola mucosus]MBD0413339.1 anti-sigma factor [Oryzicola mucosus]
MTSAEEDRAVPGGDDMVAAEYVLGVQPLDERQQAARRVDTEPDFARLVDAWEVRLSPLAAGYPEIEAPFAVKQAIDRRLSRNDRRKRAGFWSSLVLWRGLAGMAVLGFALALAVPYMLENRSQTPPVRMVASLAAPGTDVQYLAMFDAQKAELGLSHVSGEREANHDFELWMIEPNKAPVSMGVIPVGSTAHMTLDQATLAKLAGGAVLAITLEPPGGSPTGDPTGPVVASGDLRQI